MQNSLDPSLTAAVKPNQKEENVINEGQLN